MTFKMKKFLLHALNILVVLLIVWFVPQVRNDTMRLGATYLFPGGGGTGTSTAPSVGQILVGNAAGTYSLSASSTLFSGTTGQVAFFPSSGALTGTSSLFIAPAGQVGIGTVRPIEVNANSKLTIAGPGSQDIIASTTDITTASDAILQAYADTARTFLGSHGSAQVASRYGLVLGGWGEISLFTTKAVVPNGLVIGTNPAVPLVFGTNSIERMRILSSGNVGIGTTSPYAKFSIQSFSTDTNTALFVIASSTVSATTTLLSVSNTGAVTLSIPLAASSGGTGFASFTSGDIMYATGATTLSKVASSTGGTIFQTSFTTGAPTWVATSSLKINLNDTTGASGSFVTGSTFQNVVRRSFTYATTSWAGTTTVPIESGFGEVWNNIQCFTDAGTVGIDAYHASSHMNFVVASSTNGITAFTSNNTITANDKTFIDLGTPATSPKTIACTIKYTF